MLAAAAAEDVTLLDAEGVAESPGAGLVGRIEGHSITATGRGKLSGGTKP